MLVPLIACVAIAGQPGMGDAASEDLYAFGSGSLGNVWKQDEHALPYYEFNASFALPGPASGATAWKAGIQLGNDRYVGVMGADNAISVRQDEGAPKLLNAQWQMWPAGIGYVSSAAGGGALVSSLHTAAAPTKRRACVGYVARISENAGLSLSHTLIAPFGDDPVIVSEVTVTNTGTKATAADLKYSESWPNQWTHKEFWGNMAKSSKIQNSSEWTRMWSPRVFAAKHYAVTSTSVTVGDEGPGTFRSAGDTFRSSGDEGPAVIGLRESRAWSGLSGEEQAMYDEINANLTAQNTSTGSGLLPHRADASVWDRTPPSTFLVSLDGDDVSAANDASRFFGGGGAAAPSALKVDGLKLSDPIACQLPESLLELLPTPVPAAACSALILQKRIGVLQPGEKKTLRLMFGYVPPHGDTLNEAALVAKYLKSAPTLLATSSKAWKESAFDFDVPNSTEAWMGRELIWHNYMLRAGTTFDDFFDEHYINQATLYFWGVGLNAAARDPLQHVMPLIYSKPETVKSQVRMTIKQFVEPSSWPKAFTESLIPYSLMMHGLIWPNRERGPSDLDLWLLLTASEHVLATRDTDWLHEKLTTFDLFGGKGKSVTVLQGLMIAFDHLATVVGVGKHGVLRLQTSDWSDVIFHDRAAITYGEKAWFQAINQSESVMNAGMASYILPRFADAITLAGGSAADSARVRAFGEGQVQACLKHAWTGVGADGEAWLKRAYVSDNYTTPTLRNDSGWIGGRADQLSTGSQSYFALSGSLDEPQRAALLKAINSRIRNDADYGAKMLEKGYTLSKNNPIGSSENGGTWFALNYPLVWALNNLNTSGSAAAALEEFKRNSMATHATVFPTQYAGATTSSDVMNSRLAAGGYGETGVICMHRHAWPLWGAAKLFGKLEANLRGMLLAPHESLRHKAFNFSTPLAGIAHDGSGRWSGHYRPASAAADDRWELRLQLDPTSEPVLVLEQDRNSNGRWHFEE